MPRLHLRGASLAPRAGESVEVLVDGRPVTPVEVVDDAHLAVPTDGLLPGAHRVQVRRVGPPIDPEVSATPSVSTSEVRAAQLVPTITGLARTSAGPASGRSGTVTATVVPEVRAGQRVRLLLDGPGTPPRNAVLVPPEPGAPTASVVVAFEDLPAGAYRVTLEVDGARSIPPVGGAGLFEPQEVTL
jgi:hypothetical protein